MHLLMYYMMNQNKFESNFHLGLYFNKFYVYHQASFYLQL